nr:transcription initiation factor TFIIH subunit H3 isoform 2 [Cryptomonas sp.]
MDLTCLMTTRLSENKKVLILILSFKHLDFDKSSMKKIKPVRNILCKNSHFNRLSEQILIFSFIYIFYTCETYINLILSCNISKWVYPFLSNEIDKESRKKNTLISIRNSFTEELKIAENTIETQEFKRKNFFSNPLLAFCSVFYLFSILSKKGFNYKFQILTFSSVEIQERDVIIWKKIFHLAEKLQINLDFMSLSCKTSDIFHYGSYKTKGIYCKPARKTNQLLALGGLLNIVITIFLPSPLIRQFFTLPLATRSSFNYFVGNGRKKKWITCPTCSSMYVSLFLKCFICGKLLLN